MFGFFLYICNMKIRTVKDKKNIRKQIMDSAIASFRIEGIHISKEAAIETLKKVELTLGK